jgi:uncharacterized OsmC-like protein
MSPITIFAISAAVGFAGTMAVLSHIDKKKKNVIETTSTETEDDEVDETEKPTIINTVSVFISTPFAGLDNETIKKNIEFAKEEASSRVKKLENDENIKIEFVHNFKENDEGKKPCQLIAEAISKMADCDYVYFTAGWEDSEGCKIEQEIANRYGMQRIYSY